MKVYGPYLRKDGRKHVILYENGTRTTVSYPKYLLEQHLGRKLEDWETADHIDDDFTNDTIENLQVLSRIDNVRKSSTPAEMIEIICTRCGCKAVKRARDIRGNEKKGFLDHFCSRSCAGKTQREREVKEQREALRAVGL